MKGWERRIGRWRIIYSRGWVSPAYGIRLLLVWRGGRRFAGSWVLVNDVEWQRGKANERGRNFILRNPEPTEEDKRRARNLAVRLGRVPPT